MAKNKGGRPSKYKPEFCEMLIEHMNDGFSFEAFAAIVDVCEDTLYEWAKVHPEFSEAKKRAYAKSRYFWEKIGKQGLWGSKDKQFNSTVWIFTMKNRFGWRDQIETHSNINIDGIVFDSEYEPDDK